MKEEIRREYWSNGQLRYEISYLNEKVHGVQKGWYSNGQIGYEIPLKNNIQCGAMILFYY